MLIDFETDGAGNPTGAAIAANEYAALGLTDIDPSTGIIALIDTNPANVGTSISGKYLNVGADIAVDTSLELSFAGGVDSVSFDWATGIGTDIIQVTLFDTSDAIIGATQVVNANSDFVLPGGFTVRAGSFSATPGTSIGRVLLEDDPTGIRILILDNVRFPDAVPAPGVLGLLGLGLVVLALGRIVWR